MPARSGFEPGTATSFGLKVRTSSDGKGGTKIFYDNKSGNFGAVENLKVPVAYPELGQGPAYQEPGKSVQMRIFIDNSLLEVFVNGHTCTGVFNSNPTATTIDLFSEGGNAKLISLDIWEMKPSFSLPDK